MHLSTRIQRTVSIGMLAVTAILLMAPMAQAGNGRNNGRRYKGVHRSSHRVSQPQHSRVVYSRSSRHSNAAPIIAGVIGGFILGSAIGNAHARPVVRERVVVREARHRYYDPYCEQYYDTLDECRLASRDHRHAHIVQVIDSRRDECVETLRWERGGWQQCDDDWRDDNRRDDRWNNRRDDRRHDDRDDGWDD